MSEKLEKALDSVKDEKTFLGFLKILAKDYADEMEKEKMHPSSPFSSGANGWENSTIDSFLESAVAWGEDSISEETDNVWQRVVEIIYMGKLYE